MGFPQRNLRGQQFRLHKHCKTLESCAGAFSPDFAPCTVHHVASLDIGPCPCMTPTFFFLGKCGATCWALLLGVCMWPTSPSLCSSAWLPAGRGSLPRLASRCTAAALRSAPRAFALLLPACTQQNHTGALKQHNVGTPLLFFSVTRS